MNAIRSNKEPEPWGGPSPNRCPETYFFYEKNTGVSLFHVAAGPDGHFPREEAAGLLAMHCLVRGRSPQDFVVMVQVNREALGRLTEKAERLLQVAHAVGKPVRLTRRESEVLGGLVRGLANKEIAGSLHISQRTVKFHVSSLLRKFGMRGRTELVREVARRQPAHFAMPQSSMAREGRTYIASAPSHHSAHVGPVARARLPKVLE